MVKPYTVPITDLEGYPYLERFVEEFNGVIDYFFSMSELLAISGSVTDQSFSLQSRLNTLSKPQTLVRSFRQR